MKSTIRIQENGNKFSSLTQKQQACIIDEIEIEKSDFVPLSD